MCQLVRRGYRPFYYMPRSNLSEIDFFIERDGGIVPVEVKAQRGSSVSFDEQLKREDVRLGFKFTSGNVGVVGKKITLPHYMTMFV